MNQSLHYLVKDLSKIDLADVCSEWQWLLGNLNNITLISAVGDLFFQDASGAVNHLDTGVGEVKKLTNNLNDFEEVLKDEQKVDYLFLATLVDEKIAGGVKLNQNEVYSWKVLPSLGGEYSSDNLEPTDISVHFSLTGQLQRQIRDQPEGNPIKNISLKK